MEIALDISVLRHPLKSGVYRCRHGLTEGLIETIPEGDSLLLFAHDRFRGEKPELSPGNYSEATIESVAGRVQRRLVAATRARSPFPPEGGSETRSVMKRAVNRAVFDVTRGLERISNLPTRAVVKLLNRHSVERLLGRNGPDLREADIVVWSPQNIGFAKGPVNFYMIHDLTPVVTPEYHQPATITAFKRAMKFVRRKPFHLLTISEYSRQEIIRELEWPPERVWTVLLGVDSEFTAEADAPADVAALRARLGLPDGRLILAVGTVEPRKNLINTIRAFQTLKGQSKGSPVHLVITGDVRQGWKNQGILDLIEAHNGPGRIVTTGFVEDADLPALYRLADVFCFPSYYEGFGLPPLEAMACGTPVVTSNRTSLPEVVGDAAIQVEPAEPDAIATALSDLLESPARLAQLREAGLVQAAQFTWENAGRRLLEIFASVTEEA